MMTSALPPHSLTDGQSLPAIGLGTYALNGQEGLRAMLTAVEVGYRLFDSAVNYGNEAEVGLLVRQCGLPREQIAVTTKVPGREHSTAPACVENSLRTMGLDYLDLVLIHWPNPSQDRYVTAWEGLIQAQQRGLVRSIGVSNFTPVHLERIITSTGVPPVVNQIEVHPWFPNLTVHQFNQRKGILTQAWSPLGKRNAPFAQPPVAQAAHRLGVSPAQVLLRWHVQLGTLPLPKSAQQQRQRDNFDVARFSLDDEQMQAITALGRPEGRLFGGDPDLHEEM